MRARLNNCDIFYTSQGSGPAIVLLHGFPLNHTIWEPQVEELSRDFQVVTPDLRGHGESEATLGVYGMDLFAQDLKALLDHLRIERFILGGLSMGGYVAFAFLKQLGERVQALILADTKAEADTAEAQARREQQAQEALRDGTEPMANRLIQAMLTTETRQSDKALTSQVYEMMRLTNPIGVAGALRGMAQRPDSTPLLSSLRIPTLILVGEKDSTTPLIDAQKMAALIGGSELVIVPRSAHLTSLENPKSVNVAVRRFLERTRPQLTT